MPSDLSPAAISALLAAGGVAAALIGSLVLRLHALVVLTVCGLGVMWLTPRDHVVRAEAEQRAERFAVRDVGTFAFSDWATVTDRDTALMGYRPASGSGLGELVAILTPASPVGFGGWEDPPLIDGVELIRTARGDFSVIPLHARFIDPAAGHSQDDSTQKRGLLEPGDLLISSDDLRAARAVADLAPPARFTAAFGKTAGDIGLLVALAAVLGAGLTHSGAAERLVRALLAAVGPRGHPAAFCAGGLALGVPVFFDAVFLLCAPLAKSTALKTGRSHALLLMAVVCGGAMTHSLVPPTPGPLLVAAELGVGVPLMIGVGLGVSAAVAPVGLLWCVWRDRRRARRGRPIPLRDGADGGLDRLRAMADRPPHELPPLPLAVLPLALPVFLIAQKAGWEPHAGRLPAAAWAAADALGDPTVAVLAGTLCALGLLWRYAAPAERTAAVAAAVADGGGILLVAAAGGAFGAALRQTGVGGLAAAVPTAGGLALPALAWAVAALMRTAQGSATVAMVVAAGVVAAALPTAAVHPVWVACAIGCGSKAVAWMNSSGFWVVTRAGGLTDREALSTFTPLTGVLAVAGLAATLLGAWLWPMT